MILIIINQKQEEGIAVQCSLLSNKIYTWLLAKAISWKSNNSEASMLVYCTTLGKVLGMQVSKFAQTSPQKIDYHVYPSDIKVINVFFVNNFVFLDFSGDVIPVLHKSSSPHKVKITWCTQKNRQNGQTITLSLNTDHPQLCPVCAALQTVLRAQRLGQPDTLPVACYGTTKTVQAYITASRIAFLFWEAQKLSIRV